MADMKIDMHKQVIADSQNRANVINPELAMIKSWYGIAQTARKKHIEDWDMYEKAYKGQTWKTKGEGSPGNPQPEMNIIRATIQTILPILTDAIPGFQPLPKRPEDVDFVNMLGDQVTSIWERQEMPIKIVEFLQDSQIYDVGVLKVTWNPELEDGLGDVDITIKDPRNILVNPEASGFTRNRNCKYVIERIWKTVGEWKTDFPKMADKIVADGEKREDDKLKGAVGDGTQYLVSPVDQDKNKDQSVPGGTNMNDNKVLEGWEVWYEDNTVEEYIQGQDEKGKDIKGLKKKFPNGHLTTVLPAQNLILQTKENPYEGTDFNPYVRGIDNIQSRCFYGEGEISALMDTQKLLNKTVQQIIKIIRLMGNPVWICDKNCGVNWKALTNAVGMIIGKEPGTEVRRDFPPGVNASMFEFLNYLQRWADVVSGVQDVTQGRKPTGITAAEAIETLQEAAQTRIRLKERFLNTALAHLGRKAVSLILQYYRGTRYQRVSGEDAEHPKFVTFSIEPDLVMDEEGQAEEILNIRRQAKVWSPEAGTYENMPIEEAQAAFGVYDVEIASGTALPFQKAERSRLALRLFENGAIDQEALLEVLDWQDREKILERMKQAAQEQAQAQAATPLQQQGA